MSTDAIVLLKTDHKDIREQFRRFQQAGENAAAAKGRIVEKIIELLTVHTYIENEVMYPEVRRLLSGARDVLATRSSGLDGIAPAVVGGLDAAAGVVSHGHPLSAARADRQALQQGRAFPCRAALPVGAVGLAVGQQGLLVGLVLFEGQVAGVRVGDQREPLLAGHGDDGRFPGRGTGSAASPVGESACVAGVVQGAEHPPVLQRHPDQFAFVGPGADPYWEQQPGVR